jgi:hypothetical protein
MPPPSLLHIPRSILADCRFAGAPNLPGTTPRPSGSGLTGSDIGLLMIILDGALSANDNNNVIVTQRRLRQLAGKGDPVRISAALDRLVGTDLVHGRSLYPCVISHAHLGKGTREPSWAVQLHPRLVDLFRRYAAKDIMTELNPEAMKPLSSRFSMCLWLRWMSILDGAYPPDQIGFGMDGETAAMQISVKLDDIPAFFGRTERMLPSEIDKILVTRSKRCPIAREMHAAGVACDIVATKRAGFKDRYGIEIMLTTLQHEGLAYIAAIERHRRLRLEAKRAARISRMDRDKESASSA